MYKLSTSNDLLTTKDYALLYEMIEDRGVMLSPFDFSQKVSLDDYLDQDEELTQLLKLNPDTKFYKVEFNPGEFLYGIQGFGVDTLFTMHGKPVTLDADFDPLLSEEITTNPSGWVLAPCNSFYARHHMGDEFVRFNTGSLKCFDGTNGSARLQMIVNGRPVCGMEVQDDTVKTLYTFSADRDKGYDAQLLEHAQRLFSNLRYSDFFASNDQDRSGFGPKPISKGSYEPSSA